NIVCIVVLFCFFSSGSALLLCLQSLLCCYTWCVLLCLLFDVFDVFAVLAVPVGLGPVLLLAAILAIVFVTKTIAP
ncbi:hypothetical protein, partial [Cetobacterium sp.]|uniref:hypothetical protein n=1 Tax=Cetobacterium sp. TaxID=2071632 RepID=UPI003EE48817